MRPVRSDEEVGVSNLIEKRSLDLEHAKEAWDEWEIHFLILMSLSLQVFLYFTADLRRRSTSRVLSTVLWLAYLSADIVGIFVLGHLAVHARGPGHELMLFWAPFVLVHLGGQDTITAFSKQDSELWTRHLLSLVTQTAVAGYVVSLSSWPDHRLRAAMVLMFLCGFFKYAGRTFCLFMASPKMLRFLSVDTLLETLRRLRDAQHHPNHSTDGGDGAKRKGTAKERFEVMFVADRYWKWIKETGPTLDVEDIMLVDAPVDNWEITIVGDELPEMVEEFKDRPDRCIAYEYVAACLTRSYQFLYTKAPLPLVLGVVHMYRAGLFLHCLAFIVFLLPYLLFQYISTAVALVLFASAMKEGHHHSKADVTVSYVLLVGAIVLQLLPTLTSIVSLARKSFRPGTVAECVCLIFYSCIQPLGWRTRKQWSEELSQYSMIKRYTSVQDYYGCMPLLPSIWKWILKCKPLGFLCAEFFDVSRTHVTEDLKLVILDRLLLLQTRRQEWDFASLRGERALRSHRILEPQRSGSALHSSLSSTRVDFPNSVLIWHIATDMCYFLSDDHQRQGTQSDETKMEEKNKIMKMSMELSHYIMYLVFKCDVMLTTNSRLVHEKAHEELQEILLGQQSPTVNLDEKKAAIEVSDSMKKAEQEQHSTQGVAQDKNGGPANKDASTTSSSGTKQLLQSMEAALYSPVLPRAYTVAQELIGIDDEADRWDLILEVWLEMLFYTSPRCGASFHYEHLSTGGEFITHVLFLMRSLGPFMRSQGPVLLKGGTPFLQVPTVYTCSVRTIICNNYVCNNSTCNNYPVPLEGICICRRNGQNL